MSTIVRNEIKELVEIIQEQSNTILNYSEKIPQIELDIVLGNLRKLYEMYIQLDKLNTKNHSKAISVSEPEEDIVKIEKEIAQLTAENDLIVDNYLDFVANTFTNEPPVYPDNDMNEEINGSESENIVVEIPETVIKFMEVEKDELDLFANLETEILVPPIVEKEEIIVESKEEKLVPVIEKPITTVVIEETIVKEETVLVNEIIHTKSTEIITEIVEPKPKIEEKKPFNSLKGKPIDSLKKAIGINDKFQFINELFEGNMARYNKTIDNLDTAGSFNTAMDIVHDIAKELEWDTDEKAYLQLENYLQRRY